MALYLTVWAIVSLVFGALFYGGANKDIRFAGGLGFFISTVSFPLVFGLLVAPTTTVLILEIVVICLIAAMVLAFVSVMVTQWQEKRLGRDLKERVDNNPRVSEDLKEQLHWEIDQSLRRNRLL